MPRYGSGSAPIATGWKCTNCHRTHQSSIRRSDSGSAGARPELTTATSRPPRNWSAPCPVSSGKCKTILTRSDRICVLFADRNVPLIMRGCINNFMLDGVDNNAYGTSNQGFSNQVMQPSPDAIQQFKVETNNYSAEYDHAAGAVINATIKSGTNQYHGSLWE